MKRYGLIGKTLSHSFSKDYFTNKFTQNNIEAEYANFELASVDAFEKVIKTEKIDGLNVTIPYKESIIPFLDEIDETAKIIGAVNTIQFLPSGKLKGYNTDAYGFAQSIKPFLAHQHERALILGTGGASKAVHYVLNELGIETLFVTREVTKDKQVSYDDLNEHYLNAYKLIINTTPLGTFPDTNECPNIPLEHLTPEHFVYDLVYNPEETLLLKHAKNKGAITLNGLSMLKHQAEKAFTIWNGYFFLDELDHQNST